MRIVTVKMPESYIEAIDELIRIGRYSSRSEVIRAAIRDLLKRELWSQQGYNNDVKVRKGNRTKVIGLTEEV
ncbi:putative transcriptional regulators, CopG/Arc/MetJ family [Ignisphaera aggregans DSM 17230]|uniref:Putative transcriptional regulators, CopG/Arc/MetJ family n=1 Tax=Ignisphaera aggregans (strain DSM 17230 / JCM 13409 / AQ1.S1) TaxID=583356 RepID=E0STF3_IGNAA|nr:putative transcriptional regulators, CopG/Arc/MetJ family [Ignisphaera aggregans DSM 17230]